MWLLGAWRVIDCRSECDLSLQRPKYKLISFLIIVRSARLYIVVGFVVVVFVVVAVVVVGVVVVFVLVAAVSLLLLAVIFVVAVVLLGGFYPALLSVYEKDPQTECYTSGRVHRIFQQPTVSFD
eukprot:TRINITY_DN5934_c0_g1_i2.p1 TRINITY_DN5934_c0_g1~~TRINITY_DN5934_c0_g1_i2.p1  ORF type:complete len:124 (-),score=9.96 TRINITY_DN5934_c0_g1_i2:48-419(-)